MDPEIDEVETAEVEETEEVETEEVEETEEEVAEEEEETPAAQPAIDPALLAQAFVEAQKKLQAEQRTQETAAPEFDWSDPVGSVQRIVQAATSGLTKDAQDRRGLEEGILSSLKGRPQETLDFARGVLANTPTEQLRHPEAAKTLKWMALGFESENIPKKVKSTVKTDPPVVKAAGNVSSEVRTFIKNYDAAFPHMKGRMTPERAKKLMEGDN